MRIRLIRRLRVKANCTREIVFNGSFLMLLVRDLSHLTLYVSDSDRLSSSNSSAKLKLFWTSKFEEPYNLPAAMEETLKGSTLKRY